MNLNYYKRNLAILLISMLCLNVFSQAGPTVSGNNANETLVTNQQWELVPELSDEFNGNSLNPKWDPRPVVPGKFNWVGRWPVLFEEENAKVQGGQLFLESERFNTLKTDRNGSRSDWGYGGAIIRSVAKATPGMYMETLMRTNNTFLGGGFWMVTPQADCNQIPKQELDITESLGFRTFVTKQPELGWYENTANRFANGMNSTLRQRGTSCLPAVNRSGYYGPFDPSQGYHTYGAYWETANKVHFYLDGRYQGTVVPSIPFSNGMVVNLSCEAYDFNYPTGNDVTDGFKLANGQTRPLWGRSLKYQWVRTWRPAAASSNAPIGQTITLRNTENNFVWSNLNDSQNRLLSDSATGGSWANFTVVNAGGGMIALKAINGNYVSAENTTDRPLEADRDAIGEWEKFTWESLGGNRIALKANANGKYVTARLDVGGNPLQARANSAGGWETYTWQAVSSAKEAKVKPNLSINIYPNPTSNKVIYIDGLLIDEDVAIKVLAINGQVVQKNYLIGNRTNKVILNDRLTSGMYFLNIVGKNVKFTEKIIVK